MERATQSSRKSGLGAASRNEGTSGGDRDLRSVLLLNNLKALSHLQAQVKIS